MIMYADEPAYKALLPRRKGLNLADQAFTLATPVDTGCKVLSEQPLPPPNPANGVNKQTGNPRRSPRGAVVTQQTAQTSNADNKG